MTDPNTAISKYLEPQPDPSQTEYPHKYWTHGCLVDGTGLREWKPVDFEHDARLYMALFEEMAKTKSTIHDSLLYVDLYARDEKLFQVYVSHGCMCHEEVTESDTIGTAICLAYCKLHGLE